MTDGIIKEVFKSWEIECIYGNKNTIGYLTHDQIRKREKAIMQELIEKIKQKITEHEDYYHIQRGCSLKEELIGDNNE